MTNLAREAFMNNADIVLTTKFIFLIGL